MPKIVPKNDYHDKALQYIEQVFVASWFWAITYEKNRNRNATYQTYKKRLITICNWIQHVYIPRKIAENYELPRYKRKNEDDIRKLVLPFYWKAEMIEDYLYEDHFELNKKRSKKGLNSIYSLVERYEKEEVTGEYIYSVIHALRAFKAFYSAIGQLKHPLIINDQPETIHGDVRLGLIDDTIFDVLEERQVYKCRLTVHGKKASLEECLNVIKQVGKSTKYGGYYNSLVQDCLRMQLATGGRVQATLKLERNAIVLYDENNVSRNQHEKRTYHKAPFKLPLVHLLDEKREKGQATAYGEVRFFDKGAMVRHVYLTEFFYEKWRDRLDKMKENERLFPFYRLKRDASKRVMVDKKGNPLTNGLMSVEEAMQIVAELTNEASDKCHYTEEVKVKYYLYKVNGNLKGSYHLYELKNLFNEEEVEYSDEDFEIMTKERRKKWEKRREMFRQVEENGYYKETTHRKDKNEKEKEHTFEIIETTDKIKMSINSHSMRKCYLSEVLNASEGLTRTELKQMIDYHKEIQRGISKRSMKRRLDALLLSINKDTLVANDRRMKEVEKVEKELGRELTEPEKEARKLNLLGIRDFTHYELRKMICSLSGGHTRLSTLVEFYVDEDPEIIKRDREEKKHVRTIRNQQKIASMQEAFKNLIIVE